MGAPEAEGKKNAHHDYQIDESGTVDTQGRKSTQGDIPVGECGIGEAEGGTYQSWEDPAHP